MDNIRVEGMDRLQRKLKDLGRKAQELDGEHHVPLAEILSPDFMARNTDFGNAQEMFDEGGFKIESQDDFERIPDVEWDAFVAARTQFSNWEEMLTAAIGEWTSKQLGLR